MNLNPDTVLSIQAAWAQVLGVPRESLAENGTRIYREKSDSSVLMFVSLFEVGVVVGPGWAVDIARDLTDQELASHAKLLEISTPHGGQPLGEADLYFLDAVSHDAVSHNAAVPDAASLHPALLHPVPCVPHTAITVSSDPEHAAALESGCSPDDVAEVGLSGMMNTFVLLGAEGPISRPLAGCGYDIWAGRLAHMGVLTATGQRRQGYAATAVAIAVDHAMASGLVPQWRARTDNTASIRAALRAGFQHAGSQTTVFLDASA